MRTTDIPDVSSNGPSDDPLNGPPNGKHTAEHLPVLPLPDGVVFPDMVVTVTMQSTEAQQILRTAPGGRLLLVPRVDGEFAHVGVIAIIEDRVSLPDGSPTVTLRAHARARVGSGVVGQSDGLWVAVQAVVDPPPTPEVTDLATTYRATTSNLLDRIGGRRIIGALPPIDQPGPLADSIAYWPELSMQRRIELLETIDLADRLRRATEWVSEALAEIEVREKIQRDVSEDLETTQREAILRRQMAAIQDELGQSGDDSVGAYRSKLAKLQGDDGVDPAIDDSTAAAIEKEISRLERTGGESIEANWISTWLDTVFDLPWQNRSDERLDLVEARTILDADHTGLTEVKDRLVEHLAVRKLRADRKLRAEHNDRESKAENRPTETGSTRRGGAILALVGPPGVGKTSLGQSVARSLGRQFVRLALGGIRDEAEIRGHRRTYVGARPGRLVAALTEAGSMNPVILLDEIDKVAGGWNGDPSAALLEVLDPAQNHSFRDHYLEFELDLSDVVFIATANVLDTIPGPLLDRLELITLDGYTEIEKTTIAREHLVPRLLERNGLFQDEVDITDDALAAIAGRYTREAGVRHLERQLDKTLRKTATKLALTVQPDTGPSDETGPTVATDPTPPITITDDDLDALLGKPIREEEVSGRVDRPGIATGLAVTGTGGDVLFVETALVDGDGEPLLTGQLGDVMKESATIVRSVISGRAASLGFALPTDKRLHIHFPAGGIPKDGPSAGVTMTTALVSLLSGRTVRHDVAMTGEVTLQGRVLPIGGVKQKVLAAHRSGIGTVILPKDNDRDLDDIPDEVRAAVTIELVSDIDQVLDIALENAPALTSA